MDMASNNAAVVVVLYNSIDLAQPVVVTGTFISYSIRMTMVASHCSPLAVHPHLSGTKRSNHVLFSCVLLIHVLQIHAVVVSFRSRDFLRNDTRLAPWAPAFSIVVKLPVDSQKLSTPHSPHVISEITAPKRSLT